MSLESSGPVFQSGMVRTTVGTTEVWSIPDRREMELSEQEETRLSQKLSQYLVDIQTELYYTLVAHFYNYWEQCRVASAARGMSKSEMGLQNPSVRVDGERA